jgi:uncharacterized protein YdaU (DUF1376 family)
VTGLPWFKCNPRDFREGMVGLTRGERGSYATVVYLIYERAAPIEDDDAMLAQYIGCSVREWRKDREVLLRRGKLYEITVNMVPCLMNKRAAAEIQAQSDRHEKHASGGRKSKPPPKPKTKPNENKGHSGTKFEDSSKIVRAEFEDGSDKEKRDSSVVSERETTDAEASRDPSDFDGRAWDEAVRTLTRAGLPEKQARSFFGKLLAENRLLPRDMLPALTQGDITGTPELQAYLAAAARALGGRRPGAKPKRVAFV